MAHGVGAAHAGSAAAGGGSVDGVVVAATPLTCEHSISAPAPSRTLILRLTELTSPASDGEMPTWYRIQPRVSVFGATGQTTPRSRHRSIVSGGTDTPNAEASSTSEPAVIVWLVMNSKRALIGSVSTSGSGETEMSRIVIVFGYPLPQEVMGETEVDGAAKMAVARSTLVPLREVNGGGWASLPRGKVQCEALVTSRRAAKAHSALRARCLRWLADVRSAEFTGSS